MIYLKLLLLLSLLSITTKSNPLITKVDNVIDKNNLVGDNRGDCLDEIIKFKPFKSVCPNNLINPECRTVELKRPVCDEPCADNLKLGLSITVQDEPGSCCERCTCFGDPHCESFNGFFETWIICDSRKTFASKRKKDFCPMNANLCSSQTDYHGRPCVWRKKRNHRVAIDGSPCTFDISDEYPAPNITMYSADDLLFNVTLGERGIITKSTFYIRKSLLNKDHDNIIASYSLDSSECFNNNNPWKFDDRFITDRSFVNGGQDIRWVVSDSKTGVSAIILCTRNVLNGKTGVTRLNVEELIEPGNRSKRKNIGGFCHDNFIDRGLSSGSERTQQIQENGFCNGNRAQEDIKLGSQIFDHSINNVNLNGFKKSWCNDFHDTEGEVTKCTNLIKNHGWVKTWCAYNTMLSKDPTKCTGDCQVCFNEFNDFGINANLYKWDNYLENKNNDGTCTNLIDLPNELLDCQDGLTLEYLRPIDKEWVVFKALPFGTKICPDSWFKSKETSVIFRNRLRVKQCPLRASCPQNICKPEPAFEVKFTIKEGAKLCPCYEY